MTSPNNRSIRLERQVRLPVRKAVQIALTSLRIRFWRSLIAAGGTFLGIAFLVSVLTSAQVEQHTALHMDPLMAAAAKNRQMWLAGLSLLVCTVGISNSMLMSVTERFREIGTMKCLGALDYLVVELFLIESGVMGIVASLAGWMLGTLTVLISSLAKHGWEATSWILPNAFSSLVVGTGIGLFLTVVATIPPAIKASRMPPAVALRSDI